MIRNRSASPRLHVFLKRLWNTNVYDCFFGSGWEDWSRVAVENGKVTTVISGRSRDANTLAFLSSRIAAFSKDAK